MTTELLWQEPQTGRTISRSDQPEQAVLDLLSGTIWGSQSTRYRILDLPAKLARLRDPSFITLSEGGQIASVVVLDRCRKSIDARSCDAFHFVMAATRPDRRNEGIAGLLLDEVRAYCMGAVGRPGLGFAYVEETTSFSLNLSDRIGHAVEATIALVLITRLLRPRHVARPDRLAEDEVEEFRTALCAFYQGHVLEDIDRSLLPGDYMVLRRDGRIVAGMQCEILRWSVAELPGPAGWLLMNATRYLPGVKRLLDISDLRIARLGHLYWVPGHEDDLNTLLNAVLGHHEAKVGLILMDTRSDVLHRLRQSLDTGRLAGAFRTSAKMRIDVVGMDDRMLAALRAGPVLVSPADVF